MGGGDAMEVNVPTGVGCATGQISVYMPEDGVNFGVSHQPDRATLTLILKRLHYWIEGHLV
eukprot:scaffold38597_cov59-Attheya_sp.AAC.2